MAVIHPEQLIYTRVAKEYSNENQEGYQVYYASQGLRTDEKRFIQDRVCFFKPGQSSIRRRQFFSLPEGRLVLTNSVLLAPSPVNDKNLRSGAFLVHCLVFEPADFQCLQNYPFFLFDQFPFLEDENQMTDMYGPRRMKEPSCTLQVEDGITLFGGEEWAAQAAQLVSLVASSSAPGQPTQPGLLLTGSSSEIMSILRGFFRYIPVRLRTACSFDTCIDNTATAPGLYWAAGSSMAQDGFRVIDLSSIQLPDLPAPEGLELYHGWLKTKAGHPEEILQLGNEILAIQDAHVHKGAISKNQVQGEAYQSFWSVFEKDIRQILIELFVRQTNPEIAVPVFAFTVNHYPKGTLINIYNQQSLSLPNLCKIMIQWIQASPQQLNIIPAKEWKAFLQCYPQNDLDPVILFWLAAVLGDTRNARSALKKMTPDQYVQALAVMGIILDPELFLPSPHPVLFVDALKKPNLELSGKKFVDLVEQLLNSSPDFNPLDFRVKQLDQEELAQIEKLIPKLAGSAQFVKAILERRQELGKPPPGLFGRVKRALQNIGQKKTQDDA